MTNKSDTSEQDKPEHDKPEHDKPESAPGAIVVSHMDGRVQRIPVTLRTVLLDQKP